MKRSSHKVTLPQLSKNFTAIYNDVKANTLGNVATYIPELARVNSELFGVSLCTVEGQCWSIGDTDELFSLQSVSKATNYCLALEELGRDKVHMHVGREPSGHSFNALTLNSRNRPHNPMINSGAIACLSLIENQKSVSERLQHITETLGQLSASPAPRVNDAIYQSERATADRNYALAYFMREKGVFPPNTSLQDTLDIYFQCCSIEMTCKTLSQVAATFATGGINPITGERAFKAETIKDCLSLMYSCGMYDFSGEFAFLIGLPAKSGISGGLMVIIPNILGLAIYSPRVDEFGNSVRGVEFCKRMVDVFSFHQYDSLVRN